MTEFFFKDKYYQRPPLTKYKNIFELLTFCIVKIVNIRQQK